ncbi:Putative deoxyribonuclease RhsC [Vibrio ruber DSM 16370]|uniref:Putative deoxyribonuclease RhsC n=1 Tax=Vibrio ruber (strain DSM 16370 / JCM 11486 / BCRC 17186 / CECT 7878 / LMG 23124 / VR1) TaxID=1123498 RepID=A0A1R4LNT6_VIBR1|nr:RHS repeat domain-containing protein [Vibrio ruber]SJN58113.1 Putative deoxyribonuclease RhsC [Vibrio ruber DSM 16370]
MLRGKNAELLLRHKDGLIYHFGHAIGTTLRLSQISDAYGNTIRFAYERRTLKWVILSDGRLVEVKTERNRMTQLTLCEADRTPLRELASYKLRQIRQATFRARGIRYDDEKHIHYYKSAFGGIETFHLDERNRPYAIVDAAGNRLEQQWQDGLLVAETNALGETTAYSYDAWGNITTATLPDGTVHSYGYNEIISTFYPFLCI